MLCQVLVYRIPHSHQSSVQHKNSNRDNPTSYAQRLLSVTSQCIIFSSKRNIHSANPPKSPPHVSLTSSKTPRGEEEEGEEGRGSSPFPPRPPPLVDLAQQLGLQDVLSLLVLLRSLVSLIVLPPNGSLALLAHNVPHNVSTCCHVALAWLLLLDIDDGVEQICFAMLTAEVPTYDVVVVGEVCFTLRATINPVGVEIDIVRQAHGCSARSPNHLDSLFGLTRNRQRQTEDTEE